jgi:3-hydroxyacyl-[acyl-carrier-protein] dehydratase
MEQLDIVKILEHLPHRYPFLLIDRVLDCKPGDHIRALKNVTINEPFFGGHFPGYPVMPGVLVIEAMAQASALLAYQSEDAPPDKKSIIFFAGIDGARFKRPVVPGDQMIIESVQLRMVRGIGKYQTRATVDGALVAEAQLLAALRSL